MEAKLILRKILDELIEELKRDGVHAIRYEDEVGGRVIYINHERRDAMMNLSLALQDKIDMAIQLMNYLKILPHPEEEGEVSNLNIYSGDRFE